MPNQICKEKLTANETCKWASASFVTHLQDSWNHIKEYFSFKSSWMMLFKPNRNIDNLTKQFCAWKKIKINLSDIWYVRQSYC